MHLFSVTGERQQGLECGCCVKIVSFQADVFASDEQTARGIVGSAWRFNQVRIDDPEDRGIIEQVQTPGIKINSQVEVWRGYHGDSSFSQSPAKAS